MDSPFLLRIRLAALLPAFWLGFGHAAPIKQGAFDAPYFNWKSLQLTDAIVEVRGSGAHKVAVFTDTDCGYCRKYEKTLAEIDNVTIYRFLTPLSESGNRKALLIWCSSGNNNVRLANLHAFMKGEGTELHKTDCANPIQRNISYAKSQDLYFTPSTVSNEGRVAKGYLPLANLQRWLSGKPAF